MVRRILPGITLRQRPPMRNRSLLLEPLSERIVLTGAASTVVMDSPDDPAVEAPPAPVEAESSSTETTASVYLDSEGVVHVEPTSPETDIVVREFLNYELQQVIEVEAAGQWTAFPVEEVQQIQVQQLSETQSVDVTEGVSVPVELSADSVDAALVSADDSLLTPDAVAPATSSLSDSTAEGEYPGGSYTEPMNEPPTIVDFGVYETPSGEWIVTGRVLDDKGTAGLEVKLDGLVQAEVQTNSNGIFSYLTHFPSGTFGAVTAIATDADDAESNEAYAWVTA